MFLHLEIQVVELEELLSNLTKYLNNILTKAAMYISDDYELSDKIKVNTGLRFSYFQALEKDSSNIDLDSNIGGLVSAKEYFGLEPRLSIGYRLNSNSSIKAAYTENYQYIPYLH